MEQQTSLKLRSIVSDFCLYAGIQLFIMTVMYVLTLPLTSIQSFIQFGRPDFISGLLSLSSALGVGVVIIFRNELVNAVLTLIPEPEDDYE